MLKIKKSQALKVLAVFRVNWAKFFNIMSNSDILWKLGFYAILIIIAQYAHLPSLASSYYFYPLLFLFKPLFFLCLISNCNWKVFHTHFLFLSFRFSLLRYQVRNIQMAFSSVMFCHYKFWKCCLIDTMTHFRNSYDLAKCDIG